MEQIQRILFVHTAGGLGDLLLSSPVAEALRELYPGCHVTGWIKPAYLPLLSGNPSFDALMGEPGGTEHAADCIGRPGGLITRARALRAEQYDLAVTTWSRWDLAWAVTLAGIPVRVGQGGRALYSFLFTHKVDVRSTHGDASTHWVDCQLDYARALGWRGTAPSPRVVLTAAERAVGREVLLSNGVAPGARVCGLHVGKGLRLTPERWPVQKFAAIGNLVSRRLGCTVVLTGDATEMGLVRRVEQEMCCAPVNLAGKTGLRELAGVISAMDLMICPDSGPMHIAAALGVPVVAIFALASDFPDRWRPYGVRHRVVRTRHFACPRRCIKESCPRFECLLHIDEEDVLDAAEELLGGSSFGDRG